ncbi:MAG: hypothetical protein AAF414_06330 [Pseudomonadota bacterium]
MIYYVCRARHAYTVGVLLSYFGPALDDTVRIIPYERLDLVDGQAGDAFIWTDLDRLSLQEAEDAAAVRQRILAEQPGALQLNHPVDSLRRYGLLRHLAADGMNGFNVYRFSEVTPDISFPAFVRLESGASRHTPILLNDWGELEAAMKRQIARGGDESDLLVVEFGAKPGPDGRFRKYGIFRIGDEVFPQDCVVSDDWYIKYASRTGAADTKRENEDYLRTNPHAKEALAIFEKARIEFGRMDYGIVDGRLQVYEINTNPTFITQPASRYDDFDRAGRARHYQEAFVRLHTVAREKAGLEPSAVSATSPDIDRVHQEVLEQVRRRVDRRHRRRLARGFIASLGARAGGLLRGKR